MPAEAGSSRPSGRSTSSPADDTAPTVPQPQPQPDAVVVVLHDHGQVLIIRRAASVAYPGFWTPPSGRVEPGESQDQTVVREMREELLLDVVPGQKVWECDTHDGVYRLHWWTATLAAAATRTPTPDPREVAAARWIDSREFAGLGDTFADDRRFFADVWPTLRGQFN